MKNCKSIKQFAVILLLATFGCALNANADNCYSRGVAHCIMNDGSGNLVEGVGDVFVSTTTDVTPVWTPDTYTTETVVNEGKGSSGSVKQNYYFWAKAKPGYKFIGWNTSKTGKTAASGSDTCEGTYYMKVYTHWSAGTPEAPKEQVMYAIFEKEVSASDEPADLGDGAQMVSVGGTTEYIQGSTMSNFNVKVYFAKELAFKDVSAYTDGYGVNNSAIPFVSCKDTEGNTIKVANVRISGNTTGSETFGRIELPYTMPVGTYTVHLPYGLFNTADGGVTASCDFTVTVVADTTPFNLVNITPENGSTLTEDPEAEDYVTSVMATLTFNKVISKVNADKDITLVKENGHAFPFESCTIGILNKKQGLITFGTLPNGTYTLTVPVGVFEDINGNGNAEVSTSFTVVGSKVSEWKLPNYTEVTANPANNASVRSLTQIEISLSREGYNNPLGLVPNAPKVTISKVKEVYPEGSDANNPEILPTVVSEDVTGFTTSVKNGKLLITFSPAFADTAKVIVNIPAGIINNIPMAIANMTEQEIYEAGGCTNAAMSYTYNVYPTPLKIQRVTNQGTLNQTTGEYSYVNLVDAQLTPNNSGTFGSEDVTYIFAWYGEEFDETTLNKSKFLSECYVKNVTTGKNYSLNNYTTGLKCIGSAERKNVIQIALSGENYIQSAQRDQGEYEVYLPAGVIKTFDGMQNEGITFHFTYGDPAQAYVPESIDLDEYVGTYEPVAEEGEFDDAVENGFELIKENNNYYITKLDNVDIMIPVVGIAGSFYAEDTETNDYMFYTLSPNGATTAVFTKQDNTNYIYLDECVLQNIADPSIYYMHGNRYYVKTGATAIRNISSENVSNVAYNLAGQRISNKVKGIVIINGKKTIR